MKATTGEPWRIHFFQRHRDDDPGERVPVLEFFEAIPPQIAAEMHAVLEAVAAAPPPSFSGGGKWEAMHGEMVGMFEVRTQRGNTNYRLFCLLERDADDLGGSSIVCIDGLAKPKRSKAHEREYRRVRAFAGEFRRRRSVMS